MSHPLTGQPTIPSGVCGQARIQRMQQRLPSTGFTLVELMVVIAIIGILVALITAAAASAITAAKVARISLEISQLEQALERYKTEMGSYPPDFVGANSRLGKDHPRNTGNVILAHIRGHFRSTASVEQQRLYGNEFAGLDPSEALVFWLRGYAKNPLQPVTGGQPNAARMDDREPFYDFAKERLQDVDGDGWPEYYPQGSNRPYVYIRSDSYQLAFANELAVPSGANGATRASSRVKPYLASVVDAPQRENFIEPKKFQIISAGLDSEYGTGGQYPDGVGYSKADRDNITSFSEGKTLENAMP